MYPYFVLFFFSLLLGYVWERSDRQFQIFLASMLFIVIFLFIGLKHNVGTDSGNYLMIYNEIAQAEGLVYKLPEVGYYLLNNFSVYIDGGMLFVYLVCGALISAFTLLAAINLGLNPCYFFAIIMPFHIVMLAVSGIRQGVAESIVIYAVSNLLRNREGRFLLYIILGTMFHSSALFFSFLYIIGYQKRWLIPAILLLFPLLSSFADDSYGHYLELSLFSQGVVLRVGFLAVLAAFFLFYRNIWRDGDFLMVRLYTMSILAVPILIGLSLISTTLIDRVAYYFILVSALLLSLLISELEEPKWRSIALGVVSSISFLGLLAFSYFGNNAQNYEYHSYFIYWLSNFN